MIKEEIQELFVQGIDCLKGFQRRSRRGGDQKGSYNSEASTYLAQMADQYSGELSILATGSLTNMGGAYKKDPHFFKR